MGSASQNAADRRRKRDMTVNVAQKAPRGRRSLASCEEPA
jgi:hypothetical protein